MASAGMLRAFTRPAPTGQLWSRQLYLNTVAATSTFTSTTTLSTGSLAWARTGTSHSNVPWVHHTQCCVFASRNLTAQQHRYYSFFSKLTAEELWKGVLAETGVGARKGRGKRTKKRRKKDLNRGQLVGEGRSGFLWPGLNVPILKNGVVQGVAQRGKEEQEKVQAEMFQQREEWERKKRMKVKRERGWTGNSWGGVSLGPPDPGPRGETYEDFDTRILEVRNVFNMTAKEGRKKSTRVLVVAGNGKGAAGFAVGKASDRMSAFRKAKNKAIHYLHYVERYQDHTIYQDVSLTFKRTTIKMKKQPRGYGLRCHRAIITICRLIGIKDMYAKVTGSVNLLNLTRGVFKGLSNQETHQQLADKKGLHVVEFREESGPLPLLVASPLGVLSKEPEPQDQIPDTKLDWSEIKASQGFKRSIWSNLKRPAS
ncbi:28S ribosomal protein S5, mitochondrial [Tachyglossus aculeatus]|uniref:28S ribosomal protein S5, mitochondrial n=1 Tax=Tachyglossus aculeatus TaxID=9261 RepID=UPI0018F6E4FC|nr:28S ribosomal protein S5, mitochondrial [Tachyglossus aculeatus]